MLDNLIHRLEVAPLVVALTDAGERLEEYPDHPAHSRFLTEELVPLLEREFPLRSAPASRGLMGASFGAVAALSCAWRRLSSRERSRPPSIAARVASTSSVGLSKP